MVLPAAPPEEEEAADEERDAEDGADGDAGDRAGGEAGGWRGVVDGDDVRDGAGEERLSDGELVLLVVGGDVSGFVVSAMVETEGEGTTYASCKNVRPRK